MPPSFTSFVAFDTYPTRFHTAHTLHMSCIRPLFALTNRFFGGLYVLDLKQRRGLLEGWGFRCACKRCQLEAEEDIRLGTHPTPIDSIALGMLQRLEQIMLLGQR